MDTSVLVAASLPSNVRHRASLAWLSRLRAQEGACAAHSLAEVFSTLTRLPIPYRLPAPEALQIVRHSSTRLRVITLTAAEYVATMQRFVELGLTGAMVYDALIIECARKCRATRIYTLDAKHFRRIAPDLADRMFEP